MCQKSKRLILNLFFLRFADKHLQVWSDFQHSCDFHHANRVRKRDLPDDPGPWPLQETAAC